MDDIRRAKLEEQLREEIAALLVAGEVKDPRVGPFTSVTRVEAARDMSAAKVLISVFSLASGAAEAVPPRDDSAPDPAAAANAAAEESLLTLAVAGLNNAAGFIQSRIAKRVRLRLTPRLVFVADHGIKGGFELTERIKGLTK